MGIAIADGAESQRYHRPAGGRCRAPDAGDRYNKVCLFWRAGRCSRHPCRFLHSEQDGAKEEAHQPPQAKGSLVWRNPNADAGNKGRSTDAGNKGRPPRPKPKVLPQPETQSRHQLPPADIKAVCNPFAAGKDSSSIKGDGFSLLATLTGHQDTVTGIALPSGSSKLYSAGHDETVRAWDCHTGQCLGAAGMGGQIGCMISDDKGRWIFVGLPNAVKACSSQTSAIVTLDGPAGQVSALAVDADLNLFAGTQDGRILYWKFVGDAAGNCFEPAASLAGHQRPVVSLAIGKGALYSGSMDGTIRVWDLCTLQCLHTLSGHTDGVSSVLCWDQFLLSGSLDGTVKAWAVPEDGGLEEIHSRNEEHGVIALSGMPDAQGKPVLSCSCDDQSIRLYDLPSFRERGRIFAKGGARAVSSGPGGLFFSGDCSGDLRVWKWLADEASSST